jgi:WXG100 family type VII secretion target
MGAKQVAGPSSGQVNADLDVLQGVASKLVADFEQLQAAITTLQSESEMHAASWSGEAKNAWNTAMEGVSAAWGQLNSVLDEIASNLNVSGGQYQQSDTSNAQAINKVPTTDITRNLT